MLILLHLYGLFQLFKCFWCQMAVPRIIIGILEAEALHPQVKWCFPSWSKLFKKWRSHEFSLYMKRIRISHELFSWFYTEYVVYHVTIKIDIEIQTFIRGVGSLQKVGGHKNFQLKNFSNRIMLSLWYEKVGGHLTHFIQISAKSGWARAQCAHPAPTPL